ALELELAKVFRPLFYQRVIGVFVRATTTLDEALAHARRHTEDPLQLAWERKVWSLAVLTPKEEAQTVAALEGYLDVLERALRGRAYLVGGRFTQADLSVYPRLRMYPWVGVAVGRARPPGVLAWVRRVGARPSVAVLLA